MGEDCMILKTWKKVKKIIRMTSSDGIKIQFIMPESTTTEIVKPKKDELFSFDTIGNVEIRDYGETRVVEFPETVGCSLERRDKNLILHCEKEPKKL